MKRKLLFVYVFMAFILVCNSVYATITMDMNLTADKTTVKPGEEIAVTVTLKNISDSISSIEAGYIDVDESMVGTFSSEMIATNSNGKIEVKSGSTTNELTYIIDPTATNADYDVIFNTKNETALNGHDCRFLMDLKQDIKGDAEILGLKLKVKETATIKDVKDAVKVELAEIFSEKGEVSPVSAAVDIKVEKAAEPEAPNDTNTNVNTNTNANTANENTNVEQPKADTNTNKNTNSNANTNTNKNTNTNSNKNTNTNNNTNSNKAVNNTNTDGTVSASKLPSAGAKMLILPVIICAVLGYISYMKYLKYKDI